MEEVLSLNKVYFQLKIQLSGSLSTIANPSDQFSTFGQMGAILFPVRVSANQSWAYIFPPFLVLGHSERYNKMHTS